MSKDKKHPKKSKKAAADTPARVHRGFRLYLDGDDDPVVLEPPTVRLLVSAHASSAFGAPYATETATEADSTAEDGARTVDFGYLEWDDEEPDYTFPGVTLSPEALAPFLAHAVAETIRSAIRTTLDSVDNGDE